MKSRVYILLLIVSATFLLSCEPAIDMPYERYTIPYGKHFSTYKTELLQSDFLTFDVKFDQSAAYTCAVAENQWDTNKLFGFADCNSHHHENSVRFGWRWIEDQIEILAYCYVNGERIIENIGKTKSGIVNQYQITLTDTEYQLTMDDQSINIPRSKPCDVGAYYLLYPYFGGDETAPHDITIEIKRYY